MISEIITFKLRPGMTRAEVVATYRKTSSMWRANPDCIRKCYLYDAENRITASRRFYNLAVEEYATTLRQFPGSYVGRLFKMNVRMRFDLGIERMLIDEPVALKL